VSDESGRREQVLRVALATFARYGYKKTSMEDVARAAGISRPGLYFLFTSKQSLFQAAVTHALDEDLAAAEKALAGTARPLRDRLIEAFDSWTGRYIGVIAQDVATLIETNPELLGPVVTDYPRRFAALLIAAVTSGNAGRPDDVARTLLSTSIGIKHEVSTRDEFIARLAVAVDLFMPAPR
jgi:AcrR family transcriptional regulator